MPVRKSYEHRHCVINHTVQGEIVKQKEEVRVMIGTHVNVSFRTM